MLFVMVFKITCLVLVTALIALSQGEKVSNPAEANIAAAVDLEPTTLLPTKKTTTAPTTASTTAAPTTAAPTTVDPTTASTTTAAPTTAAPPTPAPVPDPETGKWKYTDENNKTCVIIEMAVRLNVSYTTKDKTVANGLVNIPINGTKTWEGSCGNDTQSITLQWTVLQPNVSATNNATFVFKKNTTSKQFDLEQISFAIYTVGDSFPNANNVTMKNLTHTGTLFAAPLSMSYHCTRKQSLNLTSASDPKNVNASTVEISHLQLEAFHDGNEDKFSSAADCDASDTPDIVPIAVGCALAGLVIIVLIAYLVSRRRVQARGYLSM